jgi:hypothetical protein
MRDFFISYNTNDRSWAVWIAWHLEEAGYTTILQAWDFRPGSNFIQKMQEATSETERTIAVLSPDYLTALYTQSEWQAAFSQDPTGQEGLLLPVRVRAAELKGLLKQTIFIDLVGLDEMTAQTVLLEGILRNRAKPTTAPSFPGVMDHTVERPLTYPGKQVETKPTNSESIGPANVARKCKPFSVNLAILTVDNKSQVFFSLERVCNPDQTAFYLFLFVLSQKVDGQFQERIKFSVTLGDKMSDRAQKLMNQGMTAKQLEFLKGPITSRAKSLPPGTKDDAQLSKLMEGVLDV